MEFNYHKTIVTKVNALPSRCYYRLPDEVILNEWKFAYFPSEEDADFFCNPQQTIHTPSCWQMLGYGQQQYTNIKYPFPYAPPFILTENACGVYVTTFKRTEENGFYSINFDGVDSCFYLIVNGEFVGYSSVSHSPVEFDISKFLKDDENEIRVIVFQYNSGSYLEDQDKFRMSGIYRDVYIMHRPLEHLHDYSISTDYQDGIGLIHFHCDKFCSVMLSNGKEKKGKDLSFKVHDPKLWTAETPYLYSLTIFCNGESFYEKVGIRKIECRGNVLLLNGTPLKFKGVNRHSMTVNGFVETIDDLKKDLLLIKAMNANAVRTSHYPPHPLFPQLCDEMGIYLLEEADVECHGTCSQRNFKDIPLYVNELATSTLYQEQFLDRVKRMYERDKNRSSILIWSLGNESGWGENLARGARWLHKEDQSRLVHYEGAWNLGKYVDEGLLDLYSRMYPEQKWLEEFSRDCDRPLVLCEYTHAMGNSCGDCKDYWDLIYTRKSLCGGFVWEWCSHSIIEDGKILYGGDFGEYPHDGNFCMDGIVTTDRKPNPEYFAIREVYAPVDVIREGAGFLIRNRYDFTSLKGMKCKVEIFSDGESISKKEIILGEILPREESLLEISWENPGISVIVFSFFNSKNDLLATRSFCSENKKTEEEISLQKIDYKFSARGMLKELSVADTPLLDGVVFLNNYRAPTDNDAYIKEEWLDYGLDRAKFFAMKQEHSSGKSLFQGKIVTEYMQPIGVMQVSYDYSREGEIILKASIKLLDRIETMPRFGFSFPLTKEMTDIIWFGKGFGERTIGEDFSLQTGMNVIPECMSENYVDRSYAPSFGLFSGKCEDLSYDYPKPQESGSRQETKFVAIKNKNDIGFMVDSDRDFSFQVTPFLPSEYRPHQFEMPKKEKLYLNIDYFMSGVGSNSCGPRIADKYLFTEKEFIFTIRICAWRGESLFAIHRKKMSTK